MLLIKTVPLYDGRNVVNFSILECTVVTALFATNACFVYLLSWVILHEQFVGVRVSELKGQSFKNYPL